MKKRLSEIHPIFYHTRIKQKRLFRRLADLPKSFASEIVNENLPFNCKKHQSLLRRRLGNSAPELQKLWITENHLKGAILSDAELPSSYHVFEKNHRFVQKDDKNYRENEIWRAHFDRRTGNKLDEEILVKNFAEVKYELNFASQACNL
jgi:hypothetical protein